MKPHHGTNTNFDQIRLDKCLPHKDTKAYTQYAFCTQKAIDKLQRI